MRGGPCFRSLIQSPIARSFLQSKLAARYFSSQTAPSSIMEAAEPLCYTAKDDEFAPVDWDNLGFGLVPIDYMYMMKYSKDEGFKPGQLCRFGNIELSPSAGVLNYGQGIFEGMKAYRREDGGIFLFRPEQNAIRMATGAERMCMEAPTVEQFVDAVKQTALANKRWIPPPGKGSLYIRPLLIGSGAILGLAPSPEYTFLIYASPVGNYFKEGLQGGIAPLNLYVDDEVHRASKGGVGGVKSITNYSPVMKAMGSAKKMGFSDVLYLDSVNKKYVEEISSCNIFMVKGNVISTPIANGTILEGVTRKSIIEVAHDIGIKVEERLIEVDELADAEQIFCTGTAVGIAPVGSITYKGNKIEYNTTGEMVCHKLHGTLDEIKKGSIKDEKGWIVEIN